MSELASVWRFTRVRLAASWEDLSEDQLCWRPHTEARRIAEILLHLAGAEHFWAARLTRRDPADTPWGPKLDRAVLDGFLLIAPFPFGPEDQTENNVRRVLEYSFTELEPILENPTKEQLEMKLISPVGDHVSGREGLIRIAQHAAYHTGQIWTYRMHPRFP